MLTPEEAANLKSKQNALVDLYTAGPGPTPPPTPGPTPPPTPSPTPPAGWVELKWPTSGYTRINIKAPFHVYFKVPADWPGRGAGRIAAVYTSGALQNFKSGVLSATPGGAPFAPWANIPQSKTITITWYLGPPPNSYYNPPLSLGAIYYVTVDNNPPVPAEENTNMICDLYVPY